MSQTDNITEVLIKMKQGTQVLLKVNIIYAVTYRAQKQAKVAFDLKFYSEGNQIYRIKMKSTGESIIITII